MKSYYNGGMKKMALPMRKMDEHFTYADYRDWPEDERWELIDGVAWNLTPTPPVIHQDILGKLVCGVYDFTKRNNLGMLMGPYDVFFPAYPGQEENKIDNVVQPDLIVVNDKSKFEDKRLQRRSGSLCRDSNSLHCKKRLLREI